MIQAAKLEYLNKRPDLFITNIYLIYICKRGPLYARMNIECFVRVHVVLNVIK